MMCSRGLLGMGNHHQRIRCWVLAAADLKDSAGYLPQFYPCVPCAANQVLQPDPCCSNLWLACLSVSCNSQACIF